MNEIHEIDEIHEIHEIEVLGDIISLFAVRAALVYVSRLQDTIRITIPDTSER